MQSHADVLQLPEYFCPGKWCGWDDSKVLWLIEDRSEVERLIKGYPDNEHKSFPTLDEAVNHLAENGVHEDQRVIVTSPTELQDQAAPGQDSS